MENVRSDWLFVTGAPRSGATLTSYLISLHQNAECLHETHFPIDMFFTFYPGDQSIDRIESWMPLWREASFKWVGSQEEKLGPASNIQTKIMGLIAAGGQFLKGDSPFSYCEPRFQAVMLTRACCSAIRGVCGSQSSLVFGDKSPEYCHWWGLVRELFVDCKIVYVDRDIEENAKSMVRCGFIANTVELATKEVQRYRDAIIPYNVPLMHTVKLEELEASPAEVITSMLEYLELDPSEYPMTQAIDIVQNGDLNRSRRR